MNYANLLLRMMDAGQYDQTELGSRLGVSQPTVSRWLKGSQPKLSNFESIQAEARRLGLLEDPEQPAPEPDMMPEPPPARRVPIKGYVGAGAAAHYYAVAQGDLDEVEAPDGTTPDTVAVEIRGESLGSFFDRWLVFYDDVRRPITPDLIGQLCVVGLPDDRILIKKIRKSRNGLYDLVSNTGEDLIKGVAIEWAAKVRVMTPR